MSRQLMEYQDSRSMETAAKHIGGLQKQIDELKRGQSQQQQAAAQQNQPAQTLRGSRYRGYSSVRRQRSPAIQQRRIGHRGPKGEAGAQVVGFPCINVATEPESRRMIRS